MTAAPEFTPEEPSPEDVSATVHDALADIAAATAVLSDMVPAYLQLQDTENGTFLLQTLRELRQMVASVESFTETDLVHRLPYGKSRVPGFIVEVRGGKDRKTWEDDKLAFAVTRDLTIDADGVVDEDGRQTVNAVISRILNCAAISYWRTQQLRPLGIDPDEFCEAVKGRKTVAITPDVGDAA